MSKQVALTATAAVSKAMAAITELLNYHQQVGEHRDCNEFHVRHKIAVSRTNEEKARQVEDRLRRCEESIKDKKSCFQHSETAVDEARRSLDEAEKELSDAAVKYLELKELCTR